MWLTCKHCGKNLSRKQTLENHIMRFHNGYSRKCHSDMVASRSPNKFCRTKRIDPVLEQLGAGYDNGSSYEDGTDTDPGSDSSDEDDSMVDDDEDLDDKALVNTHDNTDDVFNDVLTQTYKDMNSNEELTHKELKKAFRETYKSLVMFTRRLRKSHTHKQIMKTVNEVKERAGDFSFIEALEEGVRLRRLLLDDMVPSPDQCDNNLNDEGMTESTSNVH